MSNPMDRDFEVEPYNADEHRVAIWFADHGVGGGDDPIGSMIACLEYRNVELAATRAEIERLRMALAPFADTLNHIPAMNYQDDVQLSSEWVGAGKLTVGDLRRAAEAISHEQ
jgi:hypothetical protein